MLGGVELSIFLHLIAIIHAISNCPRQARSFAISHASNTHDLFELKVLARCPAACRDAARNGHCIREER
jgi:hypothetical protein